MHNPELKEVAQAIYVLLHRYSTVDRFGLSSYSKEYDQNLM
jgi:hypothetical protein